MEHIFASFGGEPARKFKDGLSKIQEKHIEWFESDDNKLGDIHNHCVTTLHLRSIQGVHLGYDPASNLPPGITDECRSLYEDIFFE